VLLIKDCGSLFFVQFQDVLGRQAQA
jgi:hypothetical protein